MGLLDIFKGKGPQIREKLANGAVIVDVRSPAEFKGGHAKGAKNIPLPQIANKGPQLQKLNKPVIFCCASGMRSGQATRLMRSQGLDCLNGGAWQSVARYL
jgi:Rhodanese-related sulfurtransferase